MGYSPEVGDLGARFIKGGAGWRVMSERWYHSPATIATTSGGSNFFYQYVFRTSA